MTGPDELYFKTERTCEECRKTYTPGAGPDPCLGELPGVKYACCGHGGHGWSDAYIMFENGVTIYGPDGTGFEVQINEIAAEAWAEKEYDT